MDFGFNERETDFRNEIRSFLKKELPPGWIGPVLEDLFSSEETWGMAREMARKLGKQGWLALDWPVEYGGQARTHVERNVFCEEITYRRVPGFDGFGIKMLGPTLIHFGTEQQKKEHLPLIARGERFWCEAFSEPEAGSDLASLQTSAVRQDGHWVINGQKVWTSGAHHADWCFLLARTDPKAPKRHHGLSLFLIDLKTPGIEVQPLYNIVGKHSFNQIFFEDVKMPQENLVGTEHNGWMMANALLSFERSSIELVAAGQRTFDDLVGVIKDTKEGALLFARNRLLSNRIAEMAIELAIARLITYRVAWMQDRGVFPEFEAALAKVFNSELQERLANLAMQLLGLYGALGPGSKRVMLRGAFLQKYLGAPSWKLGGGTSEIMRTMIATRGLGLPRA